MSVGRPSLATLSGGSGGQPPLDVCKLAHIYFIIKPSRTNVGHQRISEIIFVGSKPYRSLLREQGALVSLGAENR